MSAHDCPGCECDPCCEVCGGLAVAMTGGVMFKRFRITPADVAGVTVAAICIGYGFLLIAGAALGFLFRQVAASMVP